MAKLSLLLSLPPAPGVQVSPSTRKSALARCYSMNCLIPWKSEGREGPAPNLSFRLPILLEPAVDKLQGIDARLEDAAQCDGNQHAASASSGDPPPSHFIGENQGKKKIRSSADPLICILQSLDGLSALVPSRLPRSNVRETTREMRT